MGRADRSKAFANSRNTKQREQLKTLKDQGAVAKAAAPKASEAADAQELFGDPVAWEKAANTALIAAKRELEKEPNEENKARYLELKEEYKTAQKAKQANAGAAPAKKKAKGGEQLCFKFQRGECSRGTSCKFKHAAEKAEEAEELSGEEAKWTCETCQITIEATTRETHESSKKHLKKQKLAEKLAAGSTLDELMYTCHACQITIGLSAKAAHDQGKKHLLRTGDFKRGDWFCTACGQHNFASKTSCVGIRCHKPKPDEEIIAQQASSAVQGAAKKRKREAEEKEAAKVAEALQESDGDTISDQGSDQED